MSFACHFYAFVFYLYILVRHSCVTRMYSYVICMSLAFIRMSSVCDSYVIRVSLVCTCSSFVCHSYVLVCHPFITRMCHSYVLVCHSYVTRVYWYIIRMSLVCTRMSSVCHSYVIRMSLVCTRMSFACYSSVLVCYPYVIPLWFYHESLQILIITRLRIIYKFLDMIRIWNLHWRYILINEVGQ